VRQYDKYERPKQKEKKKSTDTKANEICTNKRPNRKKYTQQK